MKSPLFALTTLAGALFAGLIVLLPSGTTAERAKATTSSALPAAAVDDWPWWRGPALDGTSPGRRPVTRWSATEHVVWKAAVPGRGHSSPIVWGDRVFLTTADEAAQKQSILAFSRKSGKLLWNTVAHEGGFPRKHPKNTHASATPACDGERVYSVFLNRGALYITATDLDGKILWQQAAGAFTPEHGYGSSPVLYGSLVILNGDSMKDCFVAALDRQTGTLVWRTARKATGLNGNYATPVVATLAGKPQLILTGLREVTSYDPETGKRLWWCTGPAMVTACTAACGDNLVFATGGYPEREILAIRADGAGDVTRSHIVWRTSKGVTYVPSPLYHDGSLYVVNDTGVATRFEGTTGKQIWQGRLTGEFSSSPVLAGGLLYATNEAGTTFVMKAGPSFEVVARNDLADGGFATPAIAGGQVFLRTNRFLYCLGE
jgi:outer membrane protein assembly factor BamB